MPKFPKLKKDSHGLWLSLPQNILGLKSDDVYNLLNRGKDRKICGWTYFHAQGIKKQYLREDCNNKNLANICWYSFDSHGKVKSMAFSYNSKYYYLLNK